MTSSTCEPFDERTLANGWPRLVVHGGGSARLRDQVLVGRDPDPTLVDSEVVAVLKLDAKDDRVSRDHALFVATGRQVLVFDLNSLNGTVVVRMGSRIVVPKDGMRLEVGDLVEIGRSVVEVSSQ